MPTKFHRFSWQRTDDPPPDELRVGARWLSGYQGELRDRERSSWWECAHVHATKAAAQSCALVELARRRALET